MTLNLGLQHLQASLLVSMLVPEEPQNFDSLMGLATAQELHVVHD
jgi:hypothetical protein